MPPLPDGGTASREGYAKQLLVRGDGLARKRERRGRVPPHSQKDCRCAGDGRKDHAMRCVLPWLIISIAVASPAAAARTSLGSFENWAAFRDEAPLRCFAIARPARAGGGKWQPFAAVGSWPQSSVRGQFYVRLGRERRAGAPVTLIVGERRFTLTGAGVDAWSPDARTDAAIVATMRSARAMSVATVAATGGGFAETYVLRGAATAIDAAALGCARR